MSIEAISRAGDTMTTAVSPGLGVAEAAPFFHYDIECIGPDGQVKWTESFDNLVTTAGKTDIVDKYFKGSGYSATWKLGLKGAGTAVVGDTLASHAGWSEVTPFTGSPTRPSITFGTTSAGSNTATAVSYSINATATVAGAFVTDQATGTAGVLYSAGDFSASRSVASGDTLNVTLTVSIT